MTDVVDNGADVAQEHEAGEAGAEATVESIARELGWRPKDEFTLGEDRWVDAPAYLRSRGDKLTEARNTAKNARDDARRVAATTERMAERARQEERGRLERELAQHKDAGDTDAAVEAARRLERVSAPQTPPETAAWIAKNPWFDANPEARALAFGVVERKTAAGASMSEQLEAAETEVRKRFPELFDSGQRREERKEPPRTEGGTRVAQPPRQPGPKTQADLPPVAKEAYRVYLSKVQPEKREALSKGWIAAYFEDHQ